MINNYQAKMSIQYESEKALLDLEKNLQQAKFIQFVPDNLHFGEKNGVNFYQIQATRDNQNGATFHITSTIARRQEIPLKDKPDFPFLDKWPQPAFLSTMDVFWDNQWHSVLAGVIHAQSPEQIPELFVVNITDPENNRLLWKIPLLNFLILDVSIARFANGRWGIVLLGESEVRIFDLTTSHLMTQFIFDDFCVSMTIIDSKNNGFCDYIYVLMQGKMVKINFESSSEGLWFLSYINSEIPVDSLLKLSIIIGRHPQGMGVLIYANSVNGDLYALWDDGISLRLYFSIENNLISPVLLQHGLLLVHDKIYNAFTGEQERKTANHILGRRTWSEQYL
jgi:hypothetical protein